MQNCIFDTSRQECPSPWQVGVDFIVSYVTFCSSGPHIITCTVGWEADRLAYASGGYFRSEQGQALLAEAPQMEFFKFFDTLEELPNSEASSLVTLRERRWLYITMNAGTSVLLRTRAPIWQRAVEFRAATDRREYRDLKDLWPSELACFTRGEFAKLRKWEWQRLLKKLDGQLTYQPWHYSQAERLFLAAQESHPRLFQDNSQMGGTLVVIYRCS